MAGWSGVRTSLGEGAKPWVVAAAHEIVAACPFAIYWAWAWPGNGKTGDHPKGLALDLGNRDLGGGTSKTAGPERRALQNWVKGYALQHHARLGATFIIADRRIASLASSPDWTWRGYDGTNPHTDHVHISFEASWTYRPPEEDDMDQATFTRLLKGALADPDVKELVADAVLDKEFLEYPPGTDPTTGARLMRPVRHLIASADQHSRIAAKGDPT